MSVEGYTSYQVLIKSVVMIFPLAGPENSYCAWDLEDLNCYFGRFLVPQAEPLEMVMVCYG